MPAVGDSKRAIDEYYSEICMGGRSIINIFNECEVSTAFNSELPPMPLATLKYSWSLPLFRQFIFDLYLAARWMIC